MLTRFGRTGLAWPGLFALLFTLIIVSCAGHGDSAAQLAAKPDVAGAGTDLSKALAELDALPVPAGADKTRFVELKAKLRELLLAKGTDKLASAAPISVRSKVPYFSIAGSGGTGTLVWSYRNEGDYNLDSVVGVTDLTPLGIHFGKSSGAADWYTARAADGNIDGTVSVGDLVSIGANYGRRVEGFHLQYSTAIEGGAWSTSTDIPFASSSVTNGYRGYVITATSGMISGYYRVVPYDSGSDGIPSDPVAYPATNYYEAENNDDTGTANALPVLPFPLPLVDGNLGANNVFGDVDGDDSDWFGQPAPDNGTLSYTLTFDAAVGDLDLYLFQSGVTDPIDVSEGYGDTEHVSATVTAGVTYYAVAHLYTGFGEYRLYGSFTPQGANVPPTAGLSAVPGSGPAPLAVSFDAASSTDTDGSITKYEFDFGEGGGYQDFGLDPTVSHSYTSAGDYTATVRVTDNGGATDTATAPISVTTSGAGSVSGRIITDAGNALPYTSIVLDGNSLFINGQADGNGNYSFPDLPSGNYTLTPSRTDMIFDPPSRNVNVSGPMSGQDFTAHYTSSLTPYPFRSETYVVHPSLGTVIDVYVEPGTGVPGYSDALYTAVQNAVPRWNNVGDPWGLFHIQFTSNINQAEIWIHWIESFPGTKLGEASWSGTNWQIDLPMEIKLATTVMGNPIDGPTEEKGAIHEVGHTLGLWDHSNLDTDIMYPIATQSWPSLRDSWTIYTLYHTTPDWTTGGRGGSRSGPHKYMKFTID